MKVFRWRPDGPLSFHIERIWGWESDGPEKTAFPLVLPGTGADVFFHYRAPFRFHDPAGIVREAPLAHLICARRKAINLLTGDSVGFIAVRLRAGSLYRFTNVPADELADSLLPTDELWNADGRTLSDAVRAAGNWPERLTAITRFLTDRLDRHRPDELVERAVRHIYYGCSNISIARLAERLGIGRRQLERRMRSVTGQSPVEIRSASRFQKVMRHMLLNPTDNFLVTLLDFGFYDQAHFSRACRAFDLPPPCRTLAMAQRMTHFYNPPLNDPASLRVSAPVHSGRQAEAKWDDGGRNIRILAEARRRQEQLSGHGGEPHAAGSKD